MAMDNFREDVVIKRRQGLSTAIYYLCWIVLVVFGLFGVIELYASIGTIGRGSFAWGDLIIAIIMIGVAVLLWLKKDTLRVEYEYTFTNGILDVSEVLNNSKRKYLAEIPLSLVESCGSVNHPSFQRYLNDKAVKTHNWFLNRDADLIYLYFVKNNVRHLAVLEPSKEMQQMMRFKNYLGFGVWQETKPVKEGV